MAVFIDEPILKSIKAGLGLEEDYDAFDFELITYINSALAELSQIGVGPVEGIDIDSNTMWSAILDSKSKLNNAKTYVHLKTKLIFDSSGMTQHVIAAHERMIEEAAWRLTVAADPMIPQVAPPTDDEEI